jgi:hypothetical protein
VPVTAKLSREFYEKLGDRVVNKLAEWLNEVDATYKLELRQLNDLNWARFDAKLEQRVAELRAHTDAGLAALEGRLLASLDALEGRMLARTGVLEGRFGTLEGRLVRWMFAFWVASVGAWLALIRLTR